MEDKKKYLIPIGITIGGIVVLFVLFSWLDRRHQEKRIPSMAKSFLEYMDDNPMDRSSDAGPDTEV